MEVKRRGKIKKLINIFKAFKQGNVNLENNFIQNFIHIFSNVSAILVIPSELKILENAVGFKGDKNLFLVI